MPLFEHACPNEKCSAYRVVEEHYFSQADAPLPACSVCGSVQQRIISRFGVVWTGVITAKYNDSKLERSHSETQYMWTRQTPDGKPKCVPITTFQEQREFCKREGLVNPSSVHFNSNTEVSADGKATSSQGLPGCWV